MLGSRKKAGGGTFRFRVSDAVDVPLRGTLLRLRVLEGNPSMDDLGVGSELVLTDGTGAERRLQVVAHSLTGGVASQKRLDRTRELDVIVADAETQSRDVYAEIGWTVRSPA